MKLCLAAALLITSAAAFAQTAPTPAPATAAPAATASTATATAARFTLDTPIETIAADAAAKAVLDADMPGLTANEHFDMFKSMSLHQLQPMAGGRLTDELLARVARDLAAIH